MNSTNDYLLLELIFDCCSFQLAHLLQFRAVCKKWKEVIENQFNKSRQRRSTLVLLENNHQSLKLFLKHFCNLKFKSKNKNFCLNNLLVVPKKTRSSSFLNKIHDHLPNFPCHLFPNVTRFYLFVPNLGGTILRKLITNNKNFTFNLTSLYVLVPTNDPTETQLFWNCINQLTLKSLHLYDLKNISVPTANINFQKLLYNLEHLGLSNCYGSVVKSFFQFLGPNCRSLELSGCSLNFAMLESKNSTLFKNLTFLSISKVCLNLNSNLITIFQDNYLFELSSLGSLFPNLKHLCLTELFVSVQNKFLVSPFDGQTSEQSLCIAKIHTLILSTIAPVCTSLSLNYDVFVEICSFVFERKTLHLTMPNIQHLLLYYNQDSQMIQKPTNVQFGVLEKVLPNLQSLVIQSSSWEHLQRIKLMYENQTSFLKESKLNISIKFEQI